MWILIISLFLVIGLGALAGLWYNHKLRKQLERGEIDTMPEVKEVDSECCGQHEVCEKELLIAAATATEADYFADEELDAYRGRESHAYSPDEEEAFREVLYTMRPDEVPAWVRALQVRGIALPDALKDEVLMLIDEAAQHAARPAGV